MLFGTKHAAVAICAAVLSLAGASQAAVVVGDLTGGSAFRAGGSFQRIPAPATIGFNALQSPNLYAFNERQSLELTAAFAPQIGAPLAVGRWVSSHIIAFDPATYSRAIGWVEFNAPVIAIFTTTRGLRDSNAVFGAPGTLYNRANGVGIERSDRISINATNPNRVDVNFADSSGDLVRVITSAVPEPSTWAMLITGFGLVGLFLRRRSGPRVVFA